MVISEEARVDELELLSILGEIAKHGDLLIVQSVKGVVYWEGERVDENIGGDLDNDSNDKEKRDSDWVVELMHEFVGEIWEDGSGIDIFDRSIYEGLWAHRGVVSDICEGDWLLNGWFGTWILWAKFESKEKANIQDYKLFKEKGLWEQEYNGKWSLTNST